MAVALACALALGCKQESPAPPAPMSAAAPSASVKEQLLRPLDARFEPLIGEFNGAAKQVRVLALLSPT